MAKTYDNHVILCGLGRVGLRALQQLVQLGEEVVVLEKDPQNAKITTARRMGVPVLVGNGREPEVLKDLNLAEAKSIILATDDDLANLEMALDARKIKPDIQVVLRMFDQEMASKLREAFGIRIAISTASLAAPLFATSSSDHSIENSFYVGDQLLVIARLTVLPESGLAGRSIQDVATAHRVFFLEHARTGNATHFPPGPTVLEAGDEVAVQTDPETLKVLHRENGRR